jgi:hypothetical protein
MLTENIVFNKIKEISAREMRPRPPVNTNELAVELLVAREMIMPSLTLLKQLKLINFCDKNCSAISLTLLGCTVKRGN